MSPALNRFQRLAPWEANTHAQYIGANEDPRLRGTRPDLRGAVTVPDVLIQAHSTTLGIVFYDGNQFPAEYRGDAFVTLHGSWNRETRTGYKVVRVIMRDGRATGVYEDFLTGFVADTNSVWGRPVGVTVMRACRKNAITTG